MGNLKEKIKNNLFNKSGNFNSLKIKNLKNINEELYNEIISYKINGSIYEKIYCIINDIEEKPKCPITNKELEFRSLFWGYFTYDKSLSKKEYSKHLIKNRKNGSEKISKSKKEKFTNIKKKFWNDYHDKNFVVLDDDELYKHVEEIVEKYKKSKNNKFIQGNDLDNKEKRDIYLNIYHYTENLFPITDHKTDFSRRVYHIYNKLKDIPKDSYGNELYYVNFEKGYCKYSRFDSSLEKRLRAQYKKIEKRLKQRGYTLITKLNEYEGLKHPLIYYKTDDLEKKPISKILKNGRWNNHYLDINTFKEETQIYEWLKKETNYEIIKNYRDDFELDVYIPERNIGIELNGVYWHSNNKKDKNYHINKTNYFKKRGITLLHIWDYEWNYKQNIVKSIILSKLGMISNIVYARKCDIYLPTKREKINFFNENHLQGNCNSKYEIALKYDNEIVSMISFGKRSLGRTNEFELIRFSNLLNYQVIGAASKLLSNFIKNHPHISKIKTFADLRYSDGNLYNVLGFEYKRISKPNYFYVKNGKIYNRIQFQKHKLKNKLEIFDSELSEWENMAINGYDRVYDCGNMVFEMNL